MKSHIYIANSILKRFSRLDGEKHIIDYIDCSTMTIKSSKTKSFNTERGYFTDRAERVLSDKSESLVGQVIERFEKAIDNGENIVIDDNISKTLKAYLSYQIARTDEISHKFNELYKNVFTIQAIKNALVEEENYSGMIQAIVDKSELTVLVANDTDKFILPQSSLVSFNPFSKSDYVFMQVLSPRIAIIYTEKLAEVVFPPTIVVCKGAITGTNAHILSMMVKTGSSFVVGLKYDLEQALLNKEEYKNRF